MIDKTDSPEAAEFQRLVPGANKVKFFPGKKKRKP
jgi:hypothetical protein